jgi:hypothetical protein
MPGVSICCDALPGWAETDDRGRYRLWPVPAEDRTVLAFDARGRGVLKGYLKTYYPGVTDEAAAERVRIDPGTVRVIDIEPRPATAGPTTSLTVAAQTASVSVQAVFDGPGDGTRFFEWRLWRVPDSLAWNAVTYGAGSSLNDGERPTPTKLRAGRYTLAIKPWGGWIASSARLAGQDVLDGPFTLQPGSSAELVVTLTSRRTSLEGVVRDAAGAPTADADVLVFSVNREFWTPASRRIRLVRPRSNGRYDVSGLPPGEYAVVAEQQIDPDDVDPVWLQARLPGAARVTLVEDQGQELAVRVR